MAGGGFNGGVDPVPWVELYDSVQNSWLKQPDMPSGKNQFYPYFHFPRSPTLFNWNGRAIGLFGSEDQIYKWNKENGTWSVLEGVQLPRDLIKQFRLRMILSTTAIRILV